VDWSGIEPGPPPSLVIQYRPRNTEDRIRWDIINHGNYRPAWKEKVVVYLKIFPPPRLFGNTGANYGKHAVVASILGNPNLGILPIL
jgi:hypothetical protein